MKHDLGEENISLFSKKKLLEVKWKDSKEILFLII